MNSYTKKMCLNIDSSLTDDEAFSFVHEAVLFFGFPEFTFKLRIPQLREDGRLKLFGTGLAQSLAYIDGYSNNIIQSVDPIILKVRETRSSVNWSDPDVHQKKHEYFWKKYSVYKYGVSIPVFNESGMSISMIGRRSHPVGYVEQQVLEWRLMPLLVALHNKIAQFRTAEFLKNLKLSDRELAVLRCAANGLSAKDSASVMGIKERSVIEHRREVVEKLRSDNIMHAAARGTFFKLVTPK